MAAVDAANWSTVCSLRLHYGADASGAVLVYSRRALHIRRPICNQEVSDLVDGRHGLRWNAKEPRCSRCKSDRSYSGDCGGAISVCCFADIAFSKRTCKIPLERPLYGADCRVIDMLFAFYL